MTEFYEKINNFNLPPSTNISGWWLYAAKPNLKNFDSNSNSGKWCIFRGCHEIDEAWEKIKKACNDGELIVAKVSTALGAFKHNDNHVICIYNYSWKDNDEINAIRKTLFNLGFTEPLKYKRDIDTINNVYGDKEWFIDESITNTP